MMINPVVRKEIRSTVRSWKIFGMISAYVLVMFFISLIFLSSSSRGYGFDPRNSIYLFTILSGVQIFFVMLIIPTISGAAISGERERQTLDLLLVTKMSPFSIVAGKLISSLLVVLLLIAASMPVYGLLFFYGGLSVLNIFSMILFTVLTAAMGGSIAIFLSTFTKKTIISTVICYIIFLCSTVGNIILFAVISMMIENILPMGSPTFLAYIFGMTNPFLSFLSIIETLFGTSIVGEIMYGFYDFPIWIFNCIINIFIIVVMMLLSTVLINPSNRRK